MKNNLLFVLILLVLIHAFSNTFIFIRFKFKQEFISSTLCINKGMEESMCFGSCQLKKAYQENDSQNNKSLVQLKLKDISLIFNIHHLTICRTGIPYKKPKLIGFYRSFILLKWISILFKPPENFLFN